MHLTPEQQQVCTLNAVGTRTRDLRENLNPIGGGLSHKNPRRAAASRLKQKSRTFFNEAEYSNYNIISNK